MKSIKRLTLVVAFVLVASLAAFGDCPVPGEIQTPPCTGVSQPAPADPAEEASTTEVTTSAQTPDDVYSVNTVDLLLSVLQLF